MKDTKTKLHAITEVGVFGGLNIDDPTVQEVNANDAENPDVDALIEEAVMENKKVTER